MVSINSIGYVIIYGIGLLVAFYIGKNHSKERYSKLIRRLHLNYRDDRLTRSSLLSDIPDLEEYLYKKRKRARIKPKK
jgi:hypothetical protein